jgi:3-phenylpropionate/trans-cinnamate dioxygenase ferredoxin subunit
MNEFVKVAMVNEIPQNGSLLVEVDGYEVALFNCTHDGGPLVEGTIINGCEVMCPRHGARFDIRTGEALSFPAFEPTTSYAVRVEGNEVWIESPV